MLHQDNCQQKIDLSPAPVAASSPRSAHGRKNAHAWLRSIVATGAILLLLASIFVSSQHVSAQQAATLRCRLEQTTVAVDGNATLFIEVLDVADLYGYELTLKFNGSRIHFVDADPGKTGINLQVGDFLSPDFVVLNEVNNGTGQANLALTQLSPSEAISGTGELAQATLIGIASGMVTFNFLDVVLSDPAGVAIPVAIQGCNVEVTDDTPTSTSTATPTPTVTGTPATPTPTPTPTPTATPNSDPNNALISGSVFLDTNSDGVRDPSEEEGIRAFVALYKLGSDRQWADLTDDDGNFAFNNLPAGRYFIEIRALDGVLYVFTTQSTYDIQVEVGGSAPANFGLQKATRLYFFPHLLLQSGPIVGQFETYLWYLPMGTNQPAENK